MDKVRIGILGAGRGIRLSKAVKQAKGVELTAVCDMNEERLAKAGGIIERTYTRYEDMLEADDIDAVLVASPMPLHAEHSIAALRAGKHVLSEVVAATTIDQCHELLEAVRKADTKYMFAENYCYLRTWSIVLGMVQAGLFGEVYYGEADQLQDFKKGFPPPDTGYNWRTAELAMRRGHQYISHNVGPIYQAMGERVNTVCCLGSGQHNVEWAEADDTCIVLCLTVSGKLIRIRLDFFSTRPDNYLYTGLQGTWACYEAPRGPKDEHKIHVDGVTPKGEWQNIREYNEYLPEAWKRIPEDEITDGFDSGSWIMLGDFAECVLHGTEPPINIIDALNMTAPGLMSEVSVQKGGVPVEVPEFKL